MERIWAMPNHKTFSILPIKNLLAEEMAEGEMWIDPYCGGSRVASLTNDLNPDVDADYHLSACQFLTEVHNTLHTIGGVLFDPPYSPRQIKEMYNRIGLSPTQSDTQASFWSKPKDLIALLQPRKVISFGWNTQGMGLKRGYVLTRILLVPHGGAHNDTIVTVEVRKDLV